MSRPFHTSRAIAPGAFVLALSLVCTPPAWACNLALLLAVDVSGSVDGGEYRMQIDGLADALDDPAVADALVLGQVALQVVEWSGSGMQATVLPWRRMLSPAEVALFSGRARALPRAFEGSDTAVGDALSYASGQFGPVEDCTHRVIDISGDGAQNAGDPVSEGVALAIGNDIVINAVAIEGIGLSITEFYRRLVITKGGFVMTARGHLDYPRAIREKILREVARPMG